MMKSRLHPSPSSTRRAVTNFPATSKDMLENADIEETIFQKNVPGKYSRWEGERDDLRDEDDESAGDPEEQDDIPGNNAPAGEK